MKKVETGWVCRIFRRIDPILGSVFALHEAFYDKTGLWGWSEHPESMEADSAEGVIEYLELALEDAKKFRDEILDWDTGKLVDKREYSEVKQPARQLEESENRDE